jgi:hypothetical protein
LEYLMAQHVFHLQCRLLHYVIVTALVRYASPQTADLSNYFLKHRVRSYTLLLPRLLSKSRSPVL